MSYYRILGLKREPFSTSPDPLFFYKSSEHMAALMRIMIEIRLRRGLSVILGDVGTGKTTLCRKLLQMFKVREDMEFYIILDPGYETEKLFLSALIRTFGLMADTIIEEFNLSDYRERLKNFLFKKGVEEGKTVVLLIDEAQKMNSASLEALRTLLNYETNEYKLLQLVLVGQMELVSQLREMRNLVDRINLKYILNPLDAKEVEEMINFRLHKAGYTSDKTLFDKGAIEEIYKNTQGYPRRVSMLCHNALRELLTSNKGYIDKELIQNLLLKEVLI
ncbi:MAG: AAA family ATPase [Candidatus Omnitrophica bacterium]|nr:AAA family ATPase [Candidatus Omnitrophota bacterium]